MGSLGISLARALATLCPLLEIQDSCLVAWVAVHLTAKQRALWMNFMCLGWESPSWSGACLNNLKVYALQRGGAILHVSLAVHKSSSLVDTILHLSDCRMYGHSIPLQWNGRSLILDKLSDSPQMAVTPRPPLGQVGQYILICCYELFIRSSFSAWRSFCYMYRIFYVCVWRLWWIWSCVPSLKSMLRVDQLSTYIRICEA